MERLKMTTPNNKQQFKTSLDRAEPKREWKNKSARVHDIFSKRFSFVSVVDTGVHTLIHNLV